MNNHLHIICLDIPYPPDYGGVFDLFYKLPALHSLGIKIHLHCFEYGRGEQPALDEFCERVYYYPRNYSFKYLLRLPFIVSSRINNQLLKNLSQNNYPILMEGIHCTYFLYANHFQNRKIAVRLHNVEYEYYRQLSRSEKSIFKKLWFAFESKKLFRYEKKIASKALFLAVNEKDKKTYESLNAATVQFLPVFLPFQQIESETGKGSYCLYHGNLSVAENEQAALWLSNIFLPMEKKLIIAGKNPSKHLIENLKKNKQVQLISNPAEEEMNLLIKNAHIHLLPSFNNTGIKIKLLNALAKGRFVLANEQTVAGTGLDQLCALAETPDDFQKSIIQLFEKDFSQEEIEQRKNILLPLFDNQKNAETLCQIFDLKILEGQINSPK